MEDHTCGKCLYWLPFDGHTQRGYCRLNPPCVPDEHSGRMLPDGSGRIVKRCQWPVTEQEQYCAQFKQAAGQATKGGAELWA
ncbi:hypothetical protein [Fundidesulfovibrio soli]|uniref:hypothetical protein n=1 Tax=Fundidesulfovibrio soli TaxID=2922716 RepID=UPI001FAFBD6C|nr:hypothetical protein [Fundidesulfovibrio soli]